MIGIVAPPWAPLGWLIHILIRKTRNTDTAKKRKQRKPNRTPRSKR